jgi:hypothetical protein
VARGAISRRLPPDRGADDGGARLLGGARRFAPFRALRPADRVARQVHPVVPLRRLRRGERRERKVRRERGLVRGDAGGEPVDSREEEVPDDGSSGETGEAPSGATAGVPLAGERRDVLRERAVAVAELLLEDARLERVEPGAAEPLPPLVEDLPRLGEAAVVPERGRDLEDRVGVSRRGSEYLAERLARRLGRSRSCHISPTGVRNGEGVGRGGRGPGRDPLGRGRAV